MVDFCDGYYSALYLHLFRRNSCKLNENTGKNNPAHYSSDCFAPCSLLESLWLATKKQTRTAPTTVRSCLPHSYIHAGHSTFHTYIQHSHMITNTFCSDNLITQESYDRMIHDLPIHQLTCPCCHLSGSMIRYGTYSRQIKSAAQKIRLRIQRVRCSCGHTHAILSQQLIPYSQHLLSDVFAILLESRKKHPRYDSILDHSPCIDRRNILAILHLFCRFWKERLLSERLNLTSPFDLSSSCFEHWQYQFMQIRSTPNILFPSPT